jgi:DNA polymerase-3 subunit beta
MSTKYKFHAIFDNKVLNRALNIFQNILEKKNSLENLTSTKIVISDNTAIFTGLNSTIIGVKECPVIVEVPGQIIINAHIFYDIVKKITHPEIIVSQELESNILTISAGKSIFKIPLQEKDNFPDIDINNFESKCLANNKDLLFLIDSILFTAAVNDVRHYLCGIKFLKTGNDIEAVATDGHRLAISKTHCIESDDQDIGIIIPRKTTHEISRQIKENIEGTTIIAFSMQKIGFFMDNGKTIIISKLIHGNYPNYHDIVKAQHNLEITLNNKSLIEAIERCIIILDEKNTKAMCININENDIVLTAQSDNRGYIYETIDDCSINYINVDVKEKCTSVMVNAYYLHEIAKNIKSERIILCIKEKSRPVLVKDENNENKFYYLMPMVGK